MQTAFWGRGVDLKDLKMAGHMLTMEAKRNG